MRQGWHAALALARVEWLRLVRAPTSFTLLLLVPAFQLVLFGYAIRPDAATVSIAVAGPVAERVTDVAKRLAAHRGIDVVERSATPGRAASAVAQGRALIGIELPAPRSFADPLAQQQPVRVIADATNPPLTNGAIAAIEQDYWRALAEQADAADTGPGLTIERRYNPDARADWTFLPALIGVTVMIAMIMLGALGLARERETGTWEALLGLPIPDGARIVGKLIPATLIGTVQGMLVLALGIGWFGVPHRGAVVALVLLLPLLAAVHAAIGQAIAMRASTQLSALQGAVAFYLPAMLLSGFLYPFETLPRWAQVIGQAFPLTHFIRAARGALLRGDDAGAVLAEGAPMLAVLVIAVAVMRLAGRSQLD